MWSRRTERLGKPRPRSWEAEKQRDAADRASQNGYRSGLEAAAKVVTEELEAPDDPE